MKVRTYKYPRWLTSYHLIEEPLTKLGVKEEIAENIGDFIGDHGFDWLCQKVYSLKEWLFQDRINIRHFDTWSMDYTLAKIILPMLKQLKEQKQGSPFVDYEDVPSYLVPSWTYSPYETDPLFHARWRYVLNEMIFAFEHLVDESWEDKYHVVEGEHHFEPCEKEGISKMVWDVEPVTDWDSIKEIRARMQNGFILFGKYYQNLWD